MAFTTVALTGDVVQLVGMAVTRGTVTLTLSTAMTDGTTLIAPDPITGDCDTSGAFSVSVTANDDSTTTPTGTYYAVEVDYQTMVAGSPGAKESVSFNVVVPHAAAPSMDLFSLTQLPNPLPAGWPFVSQLVAGPGITLSPAGGTGQVEITGAGGGGSSAFCIAMSMILGG